MRIFLLFIVGLLLFTTPLYALRPSSTEEIGRSSGDEETVSSQIEKESERIKTEKKNLINHIDKILDNYKIINID